MGSSSTENNHGSKHHQEQDDPCLTAMLMSSYHVFPVILYAAVDLDLFGIIAREGRGGFMSPSEVACHLPSRCPESAEILDRVLRLLASHSLLSYCTETDRDGKVVMKYGIAPAGKYYVRAADGDSAASLSLFAHHRAIVDVM
ncbi:hypothetical protein CRG98_037725 [Punica granatum]|nr:hypothetical protein CRG98_037725 [Punica granatum]